jgi:hypothetical protein
MVPAKKGTVVDDCYRKAYSKNSLLWSLFFDNCYHSPDV